MQYIKTSKLNYLPPSKINHIIQRRIEAGRGLVIVYKFAKCFSNYEFTNCFPTQKDCSIYATNWYFVTKKWSRVYPIDINRILTSIKHTEKACILLPKEILALGLLPLPSSYKFGN
jgi:hypothetical protein